MAQQGGSTAAGAGQLDSGQTARGQTARSQTQAEMTFDFDGLIQLLAGHLYSEKKVFIRELIQNAHDAIQRRATHDPHFTLEMGRIDILTDLTGATGQIVFRDNGLGMSRVDLDMFLSTIGRSGTRAAKGDTPDVIGQFGIGFLSGFVVGSRVEVRTRHWQAGPEQACLWQNDGSKHYTIEPCDRDQPVGTEVVVHLASAEDRGLLHDEAVRKVVRDYADMLRVAIYLNDPSHAAGPINTRQMPWERSGISPNEMRLDCMIYLEKTVPDSVLEVIPVNESGAINAHGLLYITRTRVIGRDAPRTIRVFQKRMFLCEDAKQLLPPWATFVNGIINTSDLSPNAARDNFARDDKFERLRDRLGELIVAHFEKLKQTEAQRLSEILAYHDLAIKAACHYYEPFFTRFVHLLEWRINARSPAASADNWRSGRLVAVGLEGNHAWANLPAIVAALPEPVGGGPKRLACFTTRSSANQYFEMADAAGSTVLDASYWFEDELLKSYAEQQRAQLGLVYVDREDDPEVFRDIDAEADRPVQVLAQVMSQLFRPGSSGRVRVEARRFQPASLPAVLKSSEAGRGVQKARDILNDPNSASDLRAMAEDMLRMRQHADMRMTINAANPLIRSMATLDFDDPQVLDLLLGIYNDAILYNQELMTPANAKVFHEQFQRLLASSTEFIRQKREIAEEYARIASQKLQRNRVPRQHLVAFLMTPFAPEFDSTRAAIRLLVEQRLGCELRTADQKTFENFIHSNVHAHLDDADFYIADVTGANPNVMLELGAVFFSQHGATTLLVQRSDSAPLPADLQGHVTGRYTLAAALADAGNPATASAQAMQAMQALDAQQVASIADQIGQAFAKHVRLTQLLENPQREAYLPAARLAELCRNLLPNPASYQQLASHYPTASRWQAARLADLERLLEQEADLAATLLKRVQQALA